MKKTVLTTLTALALTSLAYSAQANVFFGVRGGFEKYKVENSAYNLDNGKTDLILGGFVGYHQSFFRVEGEYLYHPERNFKDSNYKSETQTVMGNLYFSPPMKSVLHPYFMGGAGLALHSVKQGTGSDSNTAFAWQVGAGLELEFTEQVFLDCGARLMDMGAAQYQNQDIDTSSYLYYLGLRFEY